MWSAAAICSTLPPCARVAASAVGAPAISRSQMPSGALTLQTVRPEDVRLLPVLTQPGFDAPEPARVPEGHVVKLAGVERLRRVRNIPAAERRLALRRRRLVRQR